MSDEIYHCGPMKIRAITRTDTELRIRIQQTGMHTPRPPAALRQIGQRFVQPHDDLDFEVALSEASSVAHRSTGLGDADMIHGEQPIATGSIRREQWTCPMDPLADSEATMPYVYESTIAVRMSTARSSEAMHDCLPVWLMDGEAVLVIRRFERQGDLLS